MFSVIHKPAGHHGEGNPSDFLSRHPDPTVDARDYLSHAAEEYVNFVVNTSTPVALDIETIARETLADPLLTCVLELLNSVYCYAMKESLFRLHCNNKSFS